MLVDNLHESWRDALDRTPNNDGWRNNINKLDHFLQNELIAERAYHPLEENIFKAFDKTEFNDVRVVIIGQDPYPNGNKATGLAFSLPLNLRPRPPNPTALSASIGNIYTAIENDNVEFTRPNHGNLERWAEQGVLLLNRVLTFHKCVGCNKNIHKNKGWEKFTQAVIKALSKDNTRQLHFMLWGDEAQDLKKHINGHCYHIHAAPHPTARSNREAFLNCQHFSAVNAILSSRIIAVEEQIQGVNYDPIDWSLPQARND